MPTDQERGHISGPPPNRNAIGEFATGTPRGRTVIIIMRVACPAAFTAAVVLGLLAWSSGNFALVAVNAFLAGINIVLTSINWFWFKL